MAHLLFPRLRGKVCVHQLAPILCAKTWLAAAGGDRSVGRCSLPPRCPDLIAPRRAASAVFTACRPERAHRDDGGPDGRPLRGKPAEFSKSSGRDLRLKFPCPEAEPAARPSPPLIAIATAGVRSSRRTASASDAIASDQQVGGEPAHRCRDPRSRAAGTGLAGTGDHFSRPRSAIRRGVRSGRRHDRTTPAYCSVPGRRHNDVSVPVFQCIGMIHWMLLSRLPGEGRDAFLPWSRP